MVAEMFMKFVVKLYGLSHRIVGDRVKVFTCFFSKHLFKLNLTTLPMSTAYHPQPDVQSKAVNKCLEMYRCYFCYDNRKACAKFLPWEEFWYNTSYHLNTGMTTFKVVYGRDHPHIVKYVYATDPPDIQMLLEQRDVVMSQLKHNLLKGQQTMKKYADQKWR
jgi:hypothetical protein